MQKSSALTLLAGVFALLTAERVAAAPVTWDFLATSCHNEQGFNDACDPRTQYPVTLASLTLDGPDSSGSATYNPGLPVLTGDPFAFDLVAASSRPPSFVSTADPLGPNVPGYDPGVTEYNIRWTEISGELTAVNVSFYTQQDDVQKLRLTGGLMASDNDLAGCKDTTCGVSGYWVDALSPVSEPWMLWTLMLGFLGIIGVRYRARTREPLLWRCRLRCCCWRGPLSGNYLATQANTESGTRQQPLKT